MAGCLPGLQNIYLVTFKTPNTDSTSSPEIRVGHFALCGGDPSNFVCLSTQGKTASELKSKFRQYSAQLPYDMDAEALIQFAMTLQSRIFPPLLAASGVIFALGLVSFVLLKLDIRKSRRSAPHRTERYRKWTIIFFGLLQDWRLPPRLPWRKLPQGSSSRRKSSLGSLLLLTVPTNPQVFSITENPQHLSYRQLT
ncbi:hypothetical protein BDV96DRAFT_681797 [Lophiotrema nucula]|uniref:Uncharacterized protein n=1 Tax=Lophiotrema nucula TaxID=690887 RepID=A0A6A5ZU79_9PLEO|nr:hypothetical protein BDV96DRAFT_681797 [Lophiotrema nucula]